MPTLPAVAPVSAINTVFFFIIVVLQLLYPLSVIYFIFGYVSYTSQS
ncbi:Uncharacterised protein [Chlamydia trachomatis]|nr:Uncharacterised protein [Chlamydia trachomatis]